MPKAAAPTLADDGDPADAAVPVLGEDGAAPPPAAADPAVAVIRDEGEDGAGGDGDDDLPPHAVREDGGRVRLPLRFPCAVQYRRYGTDEVRRESLAALVFHPLTGADMRAISAQDRDEMAVFAVARSARLSPAKMRLFFDGMDARDANACTQVVGFFLAPGRPTGR